MDVTATKLADYVGRMSEFTDNEDEDGNVDIKFRGPVWLREELKQLAKVQAEVRRLGKKSEDYSSNRLINFIVRRWIRGWKKRFGEVPDTADGVKKAAERQYEHEEQAAKK